MINDRNGPAQKQEVDKLPSRSSGAELPTLRSSDSELKKDVRVIAAAAHAAVPSWASMVLMFSLILGGCCANVSDADRITGRGMSG